MWGKEYLQQRNAPVSMTPIRRFQRSSGKSTTGATYCRPALLTMMSRRPNFSTAASTRWRTSSGEETFVLTKRVLNPASLNFASARSPPGTSMSAITQFAPAWASDSTTANPIPLAPPVTIATFPFMMYSSRHYRPLFGFVWILGVCLWHTPSAMDSIALRGHGPAIHVPFRQLPAHLLLHGIRRNRH